MSQIKPVFYLDTDPVITAFGNNATRWRAEKAGLFPKRFHLMPGGKKTAYKASEVDALIEERMRGSQEAAASNAATGQRLLAARQARAQERADKVLADAQAKADRILEGRKPRGKAKGGDHDTPT